jgi:hypothetical protein
MFGDAKETVRGRKAKNRHKMATRKKDKKTSNDLQNTTQLDWPTWTPLYTGGEVKRCE